jgi:uridine kinase
MKPIIINIAGGTASGKTTVVQEIAKYVNKEDISVICMDNYYKERNDVSLEDRKKINYDHPNSFDLELLYRDLKDLREGKTINCPVYDFTVHNRHASDTIKVIPTKVIIVEGILSLYDESIRSVSDIKIFVESDPDIRFIRRLKRDMIERGRSMDNVIEQYLTTVKPMHDAFIAPTKRYADIIIPNDFDHNVATQVLAAKIKDIVNK